MPCSIDLDARRRDAHIRRAIAHFRRIDHVADYQRGAAIVKVGERVIVKMRYGNGITERAEEKKEEAQMEDA